MPEPIAQWWARRQVSRGSDVPYPVGSYRAAWQSYPMLVRQYHPEFNGGIVLSQIPPAADVFLCWQCDVGHLFVATPAEQRSRPGRERRRSSWCPDCLEAANPRTPVMPMPEGPLADAPASPLARLMGRASSVGLDGTLPTESVPSGGRNSALSTGPGESATQGTASSGLGQHGAARRRGGATGEATVGLPLRPARVATDLARTATIPSAGTRAAPPRQTQSDGAPDTPPDFFGARAAGETPGQAPSRPARRRRPTTICAKTPNLPPGDPFVSACAPPPASAVEGELRAALTERLDFTAGLNAIRLARPFFDHLEAWPDIILPELRVAIEYDSTGRFGLEHVGQREDADRRKDRALRGAGWEVVRIRTGRLPALGPHDLQVSGLSKKALDALIDELRVIRGALIVDCYLTTGD